MTVKIPDLKEMFQATMHFGHKKEYSHPRAKEYIFGLRDGINVIDLAKTQEMLQSALEYITRAVSQGEIFLLVGTKRQIKEMVKECAEKNQMPYVTDRWLGGTLTNFATIRKGIKSLEAAEARLADEQSDLTKKEKTLLQKEVKKLSEVYNGVRNMPGLPDNLFVVDIVHEHNAVAEARKKGIPIVGICDTDADPSLVDWCIPANDDAKASVALILNLVSQAIEEGKKSISTKTTDKAKIAEEETSEDLEKSVNLEDLGLVETDEEKK